VIAIALAGQPDAVVHLVESDSRKAAFLREAIRVTGAPAKVHAERIESVTERIGRNAQVVTARALAPLARILDLAAPWLSTGAKGIFSKGQDVGGELTEAAKSWNIVARTVASKTDQRGRILVVERAVRQNAAGSSLGPQWKP
jgi:16S rRNA (guanine527-N7)-methyltransferase